GNIILELNGGNAAKELVSLVLPQDGRGVGDEGGLFLRVGDGTASAVYKITGGDPSKGTLAVDTVKDLKEGMVVQFMQYKGSRDSTKSSDIAGKGFFFMATDPDVYSNEEANTSPDSMPETHRLIAARSEGGFIYGDGESSASQDVDSAIGGTSVCNVPWSSVRLLT
ncbi:hypothetical protein HK097_001894, partial [Rhizophlyctis rosea]